MAEKITFKCLTCNGELTVPTEKAGRQGKCKHCGAVNTVPRPLGMQAEAATPEAVAARRIEPPAPVYPTADVRAGGAAQVAVESLPKARGQTGLGIAALILGIVAVLICWIPFIGCGAYVLGGIGFLLGLIGLILALSQKASGIGMNIGGIVLSVIAMLVTTLVTGALMTTVGDAAQSAAQATAQGNATNQQAVESGPSRPIAAGAPDPPTSVTSPSQPPTVTWADASQPVRQGDVLIEVSNVAVDQVTLTKLGGDEVLSKDPYLLIWIGLANHSQTEKIEYRTWAGSDFSFNRDYATLRDNFDNSYSRIGDSFSLEVKDRTKQESVYPGQYVYDILVFEVPVDQASHLDLEMPASNFGGEGMIRFRIPVTMIQR